MFRTLVAATALSLCACQTGSVAPQAPRPASPAVPTSDAIHLQSDAQPDLLTLRKLYPCPVAETEPNWFDDDNTEEQKLEVARGLVRLAAWQRREARGSAAVRFSFCLEKRLTAVIERFPQSPEALSELALFRLETLRGKTNRFTVRGEYYDPNRGDDLNRAQLESIEAMLQRSQSLSPRHAKTLNALGVLNAELGNYAEARQRFEAAQLSAPAAPPPQFNLASLAMSTRHFERAERLYRNLIQMKGSEVEAGLGLSSALLALLPTDADKYDERVKEAQALLRSLKQRVPQRPDVEFNLAMLAVRSAKTEPRIEAQLAKLGQAEDHFEEFMRRTWGRPEYERHLRHAACEYMEIKYSVIICFPPEPYFEQREAAEQFLGKVCKGGQIDSIPMSSFAALRDEGVF